MSESIKITKEEYEAKVKEFVKMCLEYSAQHLDDAVITTGEVKN